jgi:hypothetical protein
VLALSVPVAQAGKYELGAQLTRAEDYGIVQFLWDGRELGEPVDLYGSSVEATGLVSLGTLPLSPGEHELSVRIIGANPQAVRAFMFGLDYLTVKTVEFEPEGPPVSPCADAW